MNRGTGGNRFIEADAGIPELMRVIFEGLHELAEYDKDKPLDLARITIETTRMPNDKISVEVAADLNPVIEEPKSSAKLKSIDPCTCVGGHHGGYPCPRCKGR